MVAGCATLRPDPPTVALAGLSLENATAFEQTVAAKLRVGNPNAVPLAIAGYRLELRLAGRSFAAATTDEALSLPAGGEALVDVRFVASTVSLLAALARAVQDGDAAPTVLGVVFADTAFGRVSVPIDEVGVLDALK